ncbi:hypothetical protein RCL1_006552 [Eukaryota sp. TZLM3-RCL]
MEPGTPKQTDPPQSDSSSETSHQSDSTPPKEVLPLLDSPKPISSEEHKPVRSFTEFYRSYQPSPPTPHHFQVLANFQRQYYPLISYLAIWRDKVRTYHRSPLGRVHGPGADNLMSNNGIVIICLGLKAQHDELKVPDEFQGINVLDISEKTTADSYLNLNLMAISEVPTELKEIAEQLENKLISELPDAYFVEAVWGGRSIILRAYVIHIHYRYHMLDAFPEFVTVGSTRATVCYYRQFVYQVGVVKRPRTRSQSLPSGRNLSSGCAIRLNSSLIEESCFATIGTLVKKNNVKMLLTTAHALPGLNLNSIETQTAFSDPCTISVTTELGEEEVELCHENSSQIRMILGNFPLDSPSVYLDVALIPLKSTFDNEIIYNANDIATEEQWLDANGKLFVQLLSQKIKRECKKDKESIQWLTTSPLRQITFKRECSPLSYRSNTSKLLLKIGSKTGISFVSPILPSTEARLLDLSSPPVLTGTCHYEINLDKVLRTCYSCIVLSAITYDPVTFSEPGDSGGLIYDLEGRVVGIFHAMGIKLCYACPIDEVQRFLGFEFV